MARHHGRCFRLSRGPSLAAPLCLLQMFGFVDMTMSDFLAAFLLTAQLQRFRRKTALQVLCLWSRPYSVWCPCS